MPTYTYECPVCHGRQDQYSPRPFGVDQSLSNLKHIPSCSNPECREPDWGGEPMMNRVPAVSNFAVKGFNAKNGYSKSTGKR